MTDDLVAFLRARLDEDEVEAYPERCGCLDANHVPSCVPTPWLDRPRREVEAKRAILTACERVPTDSGLRVAIHRLAAVYSDHPDYQQEWKP